MPTVELTTIEIAKCIDFAIRSHHTSKDEYARRNQTNAKTIIDQIATGKRAELAVYKFLTEHRIPCSYPDFHIYEAESKSFDPDLKAFNTKIAVKAMSHTQAERFGTSWIFQRSNKSGGGKDIEVFGKAEGFVVLALDWKKRITLLGAPAVKIVLPKMRDPKKASLRGIKKALYYKDIKDLPKHELWEMLIYLSSFRN